jgi:hypothetical protein
MATGEETQLRQRHQVPSLPNIAVEDPRPTPKPMYTSGTDYFRIWLVFSMCVGLMYSGYQVYLLTMTWDPVAAAATVEEVLVVTFQMESPSKEAQSTDLRIPLRSLLKLYLEQTNVNDRNPTIDV